MIKKAKEYINTAVHTGFLYIILSNILNSFFGFISGIILVRIISKGEYGIYSYANNILSYFLLFTGFGMVSGTFQICCECNHDKEKMDAAFKFGSCRGIFINLLLSACIIIYSRVAKTSIKGAEFYLLFMAFLPVVNIALEFTGIYFRSNFRNKEYAMAYMANAFLVCVISTIGAFKFGVFGIILASYLGPILSILFVSFKFRIKNERKTYILEKPYRREIWKISLVSMGANAISQLMYLIDISMIGRFIKEEELVASYRIAATIPTALYFFPSAIMAYIYPYFAANNKNMEWTVQKYKVVIGGLSLANFLISGILVAFAPQIVENVFGAQYLDAVPVFRILSMAYFWQGTFRCISSNLLVTQKKLRFNLIESILTALVNIIADYVLISRWQALGVAFATLIVMMFSAVLTTAYYVYTIKKRRYYLHGG